MRFLRAFSTGVFISTLTAGSMLGLPETIKAQDLRVIADAQAISAAHPQHEQLNSLFVGHGTGGTGLYPQINERGDVLFGARTDNGDPADYGRVQMYRYHAKAGVQHLLGDLDLLQSSGGEDISALLSSAINARFKPTITSEGEALLMCRLAGDSIDQGNNLGIVRAELEGPSDLLAQNQSALGSLSVSSIQGAIEPKDRPGEQLLAVRLNAAGTDSAILRRTAEGLTEVVRTGMLAPGTGDASFDHIPSPLGTLSNANSQGDVVFSATLSGAKVNAHNNGGLWRAHEGSLELIIRDGLHVSEEPSDCLVYGTEYARAQLNSSGHVAFHTGTTCRGIEVYSDRTGTLRREAFNGKLFNGPSGLFRIGFLNEVTIALGSLNDDHNYLKGFLSDSGDLFIHTSILNTDGTLRSGWGIVRIRLDGSAEIILESSAAHSGLGFGLGSAPYPEHVSFAHDGTMLAKVQESSNGPTMLVLWSPQRGRTAVRSGQLVGDYSLTVDYSMNINGTALSAGRAFAHVRVRALGDSPNTSPRHALLAINSAGTLSLPLVPGISTVLDSANQERVVQGFGSPFQYTSKRNVASDSGSLVMVGVLEAQEEEHSEVILLLSPSAFGFDPADFNQDGVVSVPDIFAFLSAFFAGDRRADIDLNGTVEVPDIFAFLALYFGRL